MKEKFPILWGFPKFKYFKVSVVAENLKSICHRFGCQILGPSIGLLHLSTMYSVAATEKLCHGHQCPET